MINAQLSLPDFTIYHILAEIEMADHSLTSSNKPTKTSSYSKRITTITEEEQSLLVMEGIILPTDVPLTKV